MDDEEQLIPKEEEEETTGENSHDQHHVENQNAEHVTSSAQPFSGAQPLAAADPGLGILPSLDPSSTEHGVSPPTYQQAVQQGSIPAENQQPIPNEPPPEYTGPSPGYDYNKTGDGRFHGESTMSTAEEQESTNAMEDQLGQLIVLQAILREMEERDSPNRNAPQRSSQGPRVHRIIRTPQRTIIATRSPVQSQQQAVRPQVIRTISPQGRPQMIITSPNNCRSRAGDTYRTYCMIRSIVVIVVFVIVAIAAGIGASQHKDNKGSTSHSSYWNDDYSSDTTKKRCAYNICHNGGTCWKTDSRSTCTCPTGYTGARCTYTINDVVPETTKKRCLYNNCYNGGTCWERNSVKSCDCPSYYSGAYCEEPAKHQCTLNICQNGGTCHYTGSVRTCTCPLGYSGHLCQYTDLNKCQDTTCYNGGTCSVIVDVAFCLCKPGFTGLFCQTETHSHDNEDCHTNADCLNGGTCFIGICMCPAHVSGDKCEIAGQSCGDQVCKNGGRCDIITLSCLCEDGFHGDECQHEYD